MQATKIYTTTDGRQFTDRDAAKAHQKFLTRAERVKKGLINAGFDLDTPTTIGEAASFVALHGDMFMGALTVKETRGPRKPKALEA